MKILNIIIYRFILILPLFLLFSCVENIIEFNPEIETYQSNLKHTEPLILDLDDISKTIGYQYVFIIFPFGKNSAIASKSKLAKFFEIEMLAKGFHLSKSSKYKLKIEINNLKANVYDFIVIRKLSCLADLTLEYYVDNKLIIRQDFSKNYSSFEKFAFNPKITHCINEVLLNILSESFDKKYFDYL